MKESLEKELLKLSEVDFRELELRVGISKMLKQILKSFTLVEIHSITQIPIDVLTQINNMQFDVSIREIAQLEAFI